MKSFWMKPSTITVVRNGNQYVVTGPNGERRIDKGGRGSHLGWVVFRAYETDLSDPVYDDLDDAIRAARKMVA